VQKKVGFLKQVIARLGLAKRVWAVHAHANGKPEAEKLPVVDAVVARAFTEPEGLLRLAAPYFRPGGRVVAMLGRSDRVLLEKAAAATGYQLTSLRAFTLPRSGDPRAIARFERST